MSRPDPLPPLDAFDRAARQSLREASLPAPPDWLNAQIHTAAHDQARIYAGASKPPPSAWWQAPWLKAALPAAAVASVLMALWLPQTRVTEQAVYLPEAGQLQHTPPPASPATTATQSADPPPARPPGPGAAQDGAYARGAAAQRSAAVPRRDAAPAPAAAKAQASAEAAASAQAASPAQAPEQSRQQQPPGATTAVAAARAAHELAAPPPAPAPAAPAHASRARESVEAAAPAAQRSMPTPAADNPVRAAGADARAQAPAQARMPAHTGGGLSATAPDSEFEAIRRMLREGQRDEAVKRLNALIERTPALQVPQDLQPLLTKP